MGESVVNFFIILLTFLAVGRSGEAAFTSYKHMTWNYEYDCLEMNWSEIKTVEEKLINFFNDRSDYSC